MSLVASQTRLAVVVLLIVDLEFELRLGLELGKIVLVLVKQMFHLLLHDLYFDLVPLFAVLHFAVLVAQLGLFFLELPLGDLPECVDFVAFELEVVALFPLPVQLFSYVDNMLLKLESLKFQI